MNADNLKNTWQNTRTEHVDARRLKEMRKVRNHPVLKGIRIQLVFEMLAWTTFLALYYNAFDGDKKPLYANLLLVGGSLLLIVHNVAGYFAQRNIVRGLVLLQSLQRYVDGLRKFKLVSVTSRIVAILTMLVFFGSVVQFTQTKYLLLGGILLIVPLQVWLLNRIWDGRIRHVQGVIKGLSEDDSKPC